MKKPKKKLTIYLNIYKGDSDYPVDYDCLGYTSKKRAEDDNKTLLGPRLGGKVYRKTILI